MTTQEYRNIICTMYCERKKQGGERCDSCSLNPEHTNNFILAKTAVKMIEAGVQSDGEVLLDNYIKEALIELHPLFATAER